MANRIEREHGGTLRNTGDGHSFAIEMETRTVLDHLLRTYQGMADDDLHQTARIDSDGRIFWDGIAPGMGPQIANLRGLIFSALREFDEWPKSALHLAELLENYATQIREIVGSEE